MMPQFVGNKQTYMLHVKGDSMINVGIFDGDQIFVQQCNNVRNGDIVVALEDNCMPYCCLLEDYVPNQSIGEYNPELVDVLYEFELEVLDDDRTEK